MRPIKARSIVDELFEIMEHYREYKKDRGMTLGLVGDPQLLVKFGSSAPVQQA